MTFAAKTELSDSSKFMLVRIKPKLLLSGATQISPNVYTFTVPNTYLDEEISVNGGTYSFTRSGTTVTVTCPDFDLTAATSVTILTHCLYYTGTKNRVSESVSGLPDAFWEPFIGSYPQFAQSMKNIAEGVFSLSSTELNLIMIGNDRLKPCFYEGNSLSNADVDIWACIDDLASNKRVYKGQVSSATVFEGVAKLNVQDAFMKLLKTATYQSTAKSYVYNGSVLADSPDIGDVKKAAPLVIGRSSSHVLEKGYTKNQIAEAFTDMYHLRKGLPLIHDDGILVQNSPAKYFVARFIGTDLAKITYGTVTRCYRHVMSGLTINGNTAYQVLYYIQCSNLGNCHVGDKVTSSGGGFTGDAFVCRSRQCTGPDSAQYNLVVAYNELVFSGAAPSSGLVSNPVLTDNVDYSISIFRSGNFGLDYVQYPDNGSPTQIITKDHIMYLYDQNVTCKFRVVSDGTYYGMPISRLYVDLYATSPNDTFNGNLTANEIDINSLQCRFSPNQTVLHGDLMKFIVQSAGLEVEASTFTQANTDLLRAVSVTFPLNDSSEFKTYIDDAEYCAKSTFSYLALNEDRKIEYHLIKDPNTLTVDSTRNNVTILQGTGLAKVEYQDIVSEIIFKNPQMVNQDAFFLDGAFIRASNIDAQYLHGVDKSIVYEHCLSDSPRTTEIMGYLSEPTIEYQLSTASLDLDSKIGDNIQVESNIVLTETGTAKALVMEIATASSKSEIKLNEIRGI